MGNFTTTPEERLGPGPPYTYPDLQVNLFFRIFLGIIANLCCWVPTKLLWRNGEFSATVFCIVVMILNGYYVVNSLIWRDDNVKEWYDGRGWCDLQIYTVYPLETLYNACVFGVMRNLATKVALNRATSLSKGERLRLIVVESLILFPIPLFQIVFTYFILAQRYNVSTLIGCTPAYTASWPLLIFYHLPSPIFTFGAAFFAILTWKRFRDVEKATRMAMTTNNSLIQQRHQRIRRKLFFMALSILIPFLPVDILYLVYNLVINVGSSESLLSAYNFNQIHYGNNPYPFNFISFTTSDQVSFIDMNGNYITILTVVPLFWCFGTTKEGINMYRHYLLAVGLGRFFPKLHEEYDPDRVRTGRSSTNWSQHVTDFIKSGSTISSRKGSTLPVTQEIQLNSITIPGTRNSTSSGVVPDAAHTRSAGSKAWQEMDLAADTLSTITPTAAASSRNPFIFRTGLAMPFKFPLPSFLHSNASSGRSRGRHATSTVNSSATLLRSSTRSAAVAEDEGNRGNTTWIDPGSPKPGVHVQARVWAEDKNSGKLTISQQRGGGNAGVVQVETHIDRSEETYNGDAV